MLKNDDAVGDVSRPETQPNVPGENIAIVGVGCRLPGKIHSPADLLCALREGRDCVTEIPLQRWNIEDFYDADPVTPGKTYVRHGGFLDDVEQFDASFFGIPDAEAARMDPQQRLVLQTVWHALEDAGQSPDELAKTNTGVFLAMMNTNNYNHLKVIYEGIDGTTGYDTMADAMSITAGRIAHFLDLQGPCFALDTACSGSLVALHQARQSILAGDCDSAIVVGVNLILHPGVHVAFSKVGLMSRTGRCRAFDDKADGYIRGEGCMAVFLRRESAALARKDRILATIASTAVTQDGRTLTVTAPNGQMQEKVIRLALERVGIDPKSIGYVEAHGTGTPVGDPIEMSALVNAYGIGRSDLQPLFVGSAKSSFGHIESGAGLLGLVKASLSLDQELIFPSLHFRQLNANIDLRGAPVQVPTALTAWPRTARPRRAGVNSFGFSGTNAHAVLQEAPAHLPAAPTGPARPAELIVLSAKSATGLQELVDQWTVFLDTIDPDSKDAPSLRDIAATAATGRSHMRHRLAIVAQSKEELADKLHSWREGRLARGVFAGHVAGGARPRIAFAFTGQGAQYAAMGRQLYELEPLFRAGIDRCAAIMDAELGANLVDVLFGADAAQFLGNTRYVQPAMFAVEYALAQLLRGWGVEPAYVMGHSVGEIAAACVAGVIDLEGAIRFVVARGRLMGELPAGGAMLAIEATAEQVGEWLVGQTADVSIAAINGLHSVVVSGDAAAVAAVGQRATAAGRRCKPLEVSHAFHSALMDPILPELERYAAALQISPARVPLISNVTGAVMAAGVPASYWSEHVRAPVLFHQGLSAVIAAGCSILIEIGPHPTLLPAMAAALDDAKTSSTGKPRAVPTLLRDRQDSSHILETVASVFVSGGAVRIDRVFARPDFRRVSLPLYPFRRDKHWLREELGLVMDSVAKTQTPLVVHPVFDRAVSVGSRRAVFEANVSARSPWVDHRIMGYTVFPATGYLEMAARGFAAARGAAWQSVTLRSVMFERPLMPSYAKSKRVTLNLEAGAAQGAAGESKFAISAADEAGRETYCQGRAAPADGGFEAPLRQNLLQRMKTSVSIGQFYGDARKVGFEYGANFSTVRELHIGQDGSGEALARITASPSQDAPEDHRFRLSTMLDGALQTIRAAALTLSNNAPQSTFVPRSLRALTLLRELPHQVWSHAIVKAGEDHAIQATLWITDDGGAALAHFENLELQPMSRLSLARGTAGQAVAAPVLASRAVLVEQLQKLPPDARVDVVAKWIIAEIKDILGQAAEEIDLDTLDASTAFIEIGLDSLLVTELQRRIQEKLEFRFRAMQGLDYQSIESLAVYILGDVLLPDQLGGAGSADVAVPRPHAAVV